MSNILFLCHLGKQSQNEVRKWRDNTVIAGELCDGAFLTAVAYPPQRSVQAQALICNFTEMREREESQTITGNRLLLPIPCEIEKPTTYEHSLPHSREMERANEL